MSKSLEIASFLITFREVLEAIIIISVILGYLIKTKQNAEIKNVYFGAIAGIISSLIIAGLLLTFSIEFEGFFEQLFEGTIMVLGAILITLLLFWLFSMRKGFAKGIASKVQHKISKQEKYGIFLLVFVSVFREGIETVLFLAAIALSETTFSITSAILGIIVAIILGYLLYKGLLKVNLHKLFLITEILLILFAAGLLAHGVHEFQEAGILPIFIEHVYDVNPPVVTDGEYPLLHENGIIGSIAKGLFGWNGNPSLLEILAWAFYIIFIFGVYNFYKNKN